MTVTESKTLDVLEEILATLKRIEEQGKPQQVSPVIVYNSAKLTDEDIQKAADKALRWQLPRPDGEAKKEQVKPLDPTFMTSVIKAAEEAPKGTYVTLADGEPKQCSGCSECCDD